MVGAIVGVYNLPQTSLKTLLDFDCQAPGNTGPRLRPSFLSVKRHAVDNMYTLLSIIPKKNGGVFKVEEKDILGQNNLNNP